MTDGANSWEDDLIADLRAHGGVITKGPLTGQSLLIMTSTGAKTGESRRAILTWSRDAEDYVVAGTAGGSKSDPGWLPNVRANPNVQVEAEGRAPVTATATVADDASERDRLWDQHVALLPHFAAYPEQTGRVIPMVRLRPNREG
jgi:deazaflavin-dependent oxidoreductase (nitroreductase family)